MRVVPWRVSRRAALATLAAAGLGTACRAAPEVPAHGVSIDELAEHYVRFALELAQHQPSLVEQWLGPDAWRPGARRPVPQLRAEGDRLQGAILHEAASGADAERNQYLRGQIDALVLAARRLAGASMSFLDEARAAFGPDVGQWAPRLESAAGDESTDAARIELERRLPGRGPLHERYAAFRIRHRVSKERIGGVITAAIDACRARMLAHAALPDSERVEIDADGEAALEGRARYVGGFRSRVWIAGSGPVDLARLVWLAAHESYPGHHVQHVLADRDLVRTRGWQERLLHPSFGRHLLCAEGAAEAGAGLLLEAGNFGEVCGALASHADVRAGDIDDLVAVHRAVSALDLRIVAVARAYVDGALNGEAAATALREEGLVLDAPQLLQVIERQRTRVLAYPCGRRLVAAELDAVPAASRWKRLMEIATTLTVTV